MLHWRAIARQYYYSWKKKVSFRNGERRGVWFWCLIGCAVLFLLGLAVAWIAWEKLYAEYGRKAEAFDLTEMERMETASFLYDRRGNPMGKIYLQDRVPVGWDEISPNMVNAVIAVEDNSFYSHRGIDWRGIARAAWTNWRSGSIAQGASTVTQQLARNSFDMMDRTYQRKLVEMFLAMRIEVAFSKQDIMRLYLNRVYFSSGHYGVESAARGYFGKSAKDLSVGEAATLAGLLKSPKNLSPFNDLAASTNARNVALRRMQERGFIDEATRAREAAAPLVVSDRRESGRVSYAVDAARQHVINALGYERAMNGGFHIYTTFDTDLQRAAEDALAETLKKVEASQKDYAHMTYDQFREKVRALSSTDKFPDPRYLQGALVALDSHTGGVLALVGGRDYRHSEYNRVLAARRPAGTAFTPIVFAAAFEAGIFPGDVVDDASMDNRYVMIGGESGILGEWGVETADNDYEGPVTMHTALVKGKNAATVRAGLRVGISRMKKIAAALGIASPIRDFAGSFLGNSEVTLPELTLAYTPFGQGGVRPTEPHVLTRIVDASGVTVYETNFKTTRAISPEAAYQVHHALTHALREGTGAVAVEYGLEDFPAAGKTGTVYGFTDTYFIGYNSSVTCGVWVGFDKPTPIFRGAFGKNLALPVWVRVMNTAAGIFPTDKFARPETLREVEICYNSGLLATPQCRVRVAEAVETVVSDQVDQTDQIDRSDKSDSPANPSPTEVSACAITAYATDKQMPKMLCDIHGGGIRDYSKQFGDSEWPRAVSAVNLALIKPIAIDSPALIGLADVYNSVRPGGLDAVPVLPALPVEKDEKKETKDEGENGEVTATTATTPTTPKRGTSAQPETSISNVPTTVDTAVASTTGTPSHSRTPERSVSPEAVIPITPASGTSDVTEDGIPVRRALPVERELAAPTPSPRATTVDIPVRRALPVTSEEAEPPAPAWLRAIEEIIPVRRALPVTPDADEPPIPITPATDTSETTEDGIPVRRALPITHD